MIRLLNPAALVGALVACAVAHAGAEHRKAAAELVRELERASNERDAAGLMRRAAAGVVMVSKNGEIVVGREAVADYVQRMIGASAALKAMRSRVRLEGEPLSLGERFMVTYGTSDDRYEFASGLELQIVTLWSAALVREAGEWQIAAIHYSFNLFDNPVLAAARRAAHWSAAGGLAAGFGVGIAFCWFRRRWLTQGRTK